MKIVSSLSRWVVGILFFLFSFAVLTPSLVFLSRDTTFGIARRFFALLIRIMGIRLRVEGTEHIEPGRTYLLMGNHESLFDLFVIPAAIPLTLTGVEAAYHFKIPVWGHLIRKWGCIPIQRNNLEEARKSLEIAGRTLKGGLSIVILPEGHRTRTGDMAPFKKGPFHLAKATRATILPFGISGLFEFQQRGGFYLTPGRVDVRIGPPIPFPEYETDSVDVLRGRIFKTIAHLSR
ncbi:MAG: lysophospholipid acyltransferase family protein [Desulfobacter sp.]